MHFINKIICVANTRQGGWRIKMEGTGIKITTEKALLEYLFERLSKGITEGISEKNFYMFLNEVVKNINEDKSISASKVFYETEPYKDIAQRTRELTTREYNKNVTGIDIKRGVVCPNYNLVKDNFGSSWGKYSTFGSGVRQTIMSSSLSQYVKNPKLSYFSCSKASDNNFELAKKIGAYFINDLIVRYINKKSKEGFWPSQCKNIDEYIFKRNIAAMIDEPGTKENLTNAYYHAIRVITKMLEINNYSNGKLVFSNDRKRLLAHANFLKIVLPEQISFLRHYTYNEYELFNANINASVIDNEAYYDNSECISSDPYSEWSDEYRSNKGIIDNAPVYVMERRIGKVNKDMLG